MIDFDATLGDMLAGIGWQPQGHHVILSEVTDERVYKLSQCHLVTPWWPTEPDVIVRLFRLYLKKFPQASFDSLYYDLVCPMKHGKGNAVKRGNGNDHTKSVLFEHYFTEHGVVVVITDRGTGFDYRQTHSLYEKGARYWTNHGVGFKTFAKCSSKISYYNGGRSLLVQYRVDAAPPTFSREFFAPIAHRPEPFEIVESLREIKKGSPPHYFAAKCEPALLRAFWTSPAFMETYIYPALPDQRHRVLAAMASSAELVDVTKGAATIRYQVADDTIIAKFFRRSEQGVRTYKILCAAWYCGLGAGQPYQVPRPLAYHSDRRLLLTTAIDGIALNRIVAGDIRELVSACQRSARWLLRFHATTLEARTVHGACPDGRKQTRSAGAAPNDGRWTSKPNEAYVGLLQELRAELEQRAETERQVARAIVPIHGKFGLENVLLTDDKTAVINFDRSGPGAPALDLATFAFQLWRHLFKDTGNWQGAETSTKVFLAEYAARKPEYLAGLAYCWVALILKSLERHVRRLGSAELFEHVLAFHAAQLEFARRCEEGVGRV